MLDEPGGDTSGEISGEADNVDMSSAPSVDNNEVAMESISANKKPLLKEIKLDSSEYLTEYLTKLKESKRKKENIVELKNENIYNKNFFINEELNQLITELNNHAKINE
jgi:hypothetical protein